MGGAMLTGWLAGGLDAKRVVVIEPHPSPEIGALAAQGNPAQSCSARYRRGRHAGGRGKTAVVPRGRHHVQAVHRPVDTGGLDHGRHHHRLAEAVCGGTWSAPCRTCLPHRPRNGRRRGHEVTEGSAGIRCAVARLGSVEWLDRRPDGRGDRGLGSGPAYLPSRRILAERATPPACRQSLPHGSPARPSPAPASCCFARNFRPRPCARTSLRRAAPRRLHSKC